MQFPTPTSIGESYFDPSSGRRWICSSLIPVVWSVDKNQPLLIGSYGLSSSGFSQFGNGVKISGELTAIGNATISGSATLTGGTDIYGNLEVYNGVFIRTGGLSVTGGIAGTLSTAAQPNITSLGTLTSLTTQALSVNAGATFGTAIYAPNMVTGVNGVTGAVSLTSGTNITITNSGKQITIGTSLPLSTSSVTGVALFPNEDFSVSSVGAVSLTGNVARTHIGQTFTGLQVFSSGLSSNGITGTILTPSQPNITTVGILDGLSVNNGLFVTGDSSFNENLIIKGNLTVLGTYPGGGGGGGSPGVNTVNGISGAVSIISGPNVIVTQDGNNITIEAYDSSPLAASSVTGVASFPDTDFSVSPLGAVSLTGNVARTNVGQTFAGRVSTQALNVVAGATFGAAIYAPNMVTGVNGITGAVSITSGSNITITRSDKTITVAANVSQVSLATSSITGVASFRAADFAISLTGSVSLTSVARTNATNVFGSLQMFSQGISNAGGITSDIIYSASGYEIGSSTFSALVGGYTLTPSDDGKVITFNSASPITLTGGTAVGFTGFSCTIIQLGAGQVTVSPSSVTINSFASATRLAGQHSAATLLCYSTNTFNLSGNLVT